VRYDLAVLVAAAEHIYGVSRNGEALMMIAKHSRCPSQDIAKHIGADINDVLRARLATEFLSGKKWLTSVSRFRTIANQLNS